MKLGLIGAGNMGSALARGIGEPLLVHDVVAAKAAALAEALGGEAPGSARAVAEGADVVILAHKPGQLEEVAAEIAGSVNAVASVLAATPIERLEGAYPGKPVYRFMPNVAAEVGAGLLCFAAGTHGAGGPRDELLALMRRAGRVVELPEAQLDAATAVMSSGPAFFALAAEAVADAGVRHGLAADVAQALVAEAVRGTGALMVEAGIDGREVRRRITSPGGLTARGLAALEAGGARAAFGDAVDAVVGKRS